ncbi:MAG TPA: flagellar motor switch protein FliM [Clostridiales bacterium]|nr:flagellar motor switch protein FliM [Clostridiales bacterium]
MSNVLTQQEIDELLYTLKTGKVQSLEKAHPTDEVKYKKYDFRLANKFTKEQMRSLDTIFDNFSYLLTNFLTGTLRITCEAEMISIEEQKFLEFSNNLHANELFTILAMEPLTGSSLMDLSPQTAYAMINRVLGGPADAVDKGKSNFTEIELVIMEKLLKQIIRLLEEAWSKVVPIQVSLDRMEVNPQFAQIVSASETVAIITMNIKINQIEGLMHFCLPHMSIKPIERQLSMRSIYVGKNEKKEADRKDKKIGGMIKDSRLDLIAKFNTTYTSLLDCVNLQPGDVLLLDHKVNSPIHLYVEHMPKFKGRLGVKGNKYAVHISNVVYKEEGQ